MLKTHKEIETKEILVVDAIVCNKCGTEQHRTWGDNASIEITPHWGYGSKKDCTAQLAHICEQCWDDFCATFVIPVEGYNTLWACKVDPNNNPIQESGPQLSLFTEGQLSGDANRVQGRCGHPSICSGYAPCTRDEGHDGPCAHPFDE